MPTPMQQTVPTRKPGDNNISFKVKSLNPTTYLLVDNYGHICGIFETEKQANEAAPKIKERILKEYRRRDKPKNRKK